MFSDQKSRVRVLGFKTQFLTCFHSKKNPLNLFLIHKNPLIALKKKPNKKLYGLQSSFSNIVKGLRNSI